MSMQRAIDDTVERWERAHDRRGSIPSGACSMCNEVNGICSECIVHTRSNERCAKRGSLYDRWRTHHRNKHYTILHRHHIEGCKKCEELLFKIWNELDSLRIWYKYGRD